MWLFLMLSMAALALAGAVYLVSRFHRFTPFRRLGEKRRALSWLAAALPVAAIAGIFVLFNATTMIVVLLHLIVAWLLCGLAGRLLRRALKRELRDDWVGIVAIALTAAYLGVGWYMAHHVFVTSYAFETEKLPAGESVRIVEIADSHLGVTLDGERFSTQMARVSAVSPDVVVIVGDFVDDDSDYADMVQACAALGKLDAPLGVYFVFGNHDEGYFNYRNFSSAQLRSELAKNGVVILEDERVPVGDALCVIGRKDRSTPGRMTMDALTGDMDTARYAILLDHQPNDYANEAASPVDLVLSGHTHGGHIFPAGQIGLAIGANDRVYGTERIDGTDFVVTSGISGWAIPFKTGTFSEFVVIDIVGA